MALCERWSPATTGTPRWLAVAPSALRSLWPRGAPGVAPPDGSAPLALLRPPPRGAPMDTLTVETLAAILQRMFTS
jgi:hypothetical protein